MIALAVSGVSTGWATGGPTTAAGLCEAVTTGALPYPLFGVLGVEKMMSYPYFAELRERLAWLTGHQPSTTGAGGRSPSSRPR